MLGGFSANGGRVKVPRNRVMNETTDYAVVVEIYLFIMNHKLLLPPINRWIAIAKNPIIAGITIIKNKSSAALSLE